MGATKSKPAASAPSVISRPLPQSYTRPASRSLHQTADSQYGYLHENKGEIHKGLHNEVSAFHCFINVIIQSLWHLQSWRRRFEALDFNHLNHPDPCIFCALRTIFAEFAYSDSSIIPPDQLRQALNDSDLKVARDRFRIGSMGDAEETLEYVLRWLHSESVTRDNEDVADQDFHVDVPCSPSCISHTVFGGQFMDCRVCENCHGISDPEPMNSFLYRIYAGELLAQLQTTTGAVGTRLPTLEERLKLLYKSTRYSCPNHSETQCPGPAFIDRWLLQVPLVFTLMFVWPNEVEREDISLIWSLLQNQLNLHSFLRTHADNTEMPSYVLRGVVGFYGSHYMAFFWSFSHKAWLMFDDRRVVRVGDWFDLCERVTAGKIRPILVFYETPQDLGSFADSRYLAVTMEPDKARKQPPTQPKPSQSSVPHLSQSISTNDDVFDDLEVLDYATPRETQTQIATTRRR